MVLGAEKKRGKEEEMQLAREETERLRERLESLQLDVKKLSAKLSQVNILSSNIIGWELTGRYIIFHMFNYH